MKNILKMGISGFLFHWEHIWTEADKTIISHIQNKLEYIKLITERDSLL